MFGINVSEHNPQLEIFLEKIKKVEDKISSLTIISVEDSLSAVEIRKEALSIKKEIEETRVGMVKPLNDYVDQINTKAKEFSKPILEVIESIDTKIKKYQYDQEQLALVRRREEEARIAEENRKREEIENKKREEEDLKRKEEEKKIAEQKKIADEKMKEARKASDEFEKKKLEAEAELAKQKEAFEKEKRDFEEKKRVEAEEMRKKIEQEKREKDQLELAKIESAKIKGMKKRRKFEITDESLVPREYLSPDEKKIRESVSAGIRTIAGVRIYDETGF